MLLLGNTLASALTPQVQTPPPWTPQVRMVVEPRTGTRVVLVGTVHHNPASIALARRIVDSEREHRNLRALLIESCPTRWNGTLGVRGAWRRILADEMVAAADACGSSAPLVLADQRIQRVGRRAQVLRDLTLRELAAPPSGWRRIWSDLRQGAACLPGEPDDEDAVGWADLLDPPH